MTDSFSLLTLNCFGLWRPGTQRRLHALAKILDRRSDHVICLQEIQLHKYRDLLVSSCPSYLYPWYESYIHCPKGGLLTLSRLPLESKSFVPYIERGLWYTPMLLDKLLYKGMLLAKLNWASIPIVIINSHLLANYIGHWNRHGMYARVEEKQLSQLARTVREQPSDSIVIVVGDFNIPRGGKLYYEFIESSGLTDLLAGDTRPTFQMPMAILSRDALAIDYIFIRMPYQSSFQIDCDLRLTGKEWIDGRKQAYLSDHSGIELRITTN